MITDLCINDYVIFDIYPYTNDEVVTTVVYIRYKIDETIPTALKYGKLYKYELISNPVLRYT